jgi:hypothetical protein
MTAPGSSEILAFAKALNLARYEPPSFSPGTVYDIGFHNAKLGDLTPIYVPLTMLVQPAEFEKVEP